jgi:hypothetical protein
MEAARREEQNGSGQGEGNRWEEEELKKESQNEPQRRPSFPAAVLGSGHLNEEDVSGRRKDRGGRKGNRTIAPFRRLPRRHFPALRREEDDLMSGPCCGRKGVNERGRERRERRTRCSDSAAVSLVPLQTPSLERANNAGTVRRDGGTALCEALSGEEPWVEEMEAVSMKRKK